MKTPADPVRDYLRAVEREASALPADRRQELVADLAEHVEVTRAERPDATPGEILAELGDPRTIAATALAEAGRAPGIPAEGGAGDPARRGKVHPLVPLLMLTLSLPFVMVFSESPGPLFGLLFRIMRRGAPLHLGALDHRPEDHRRTARRCRADRRHSQLEPVQRRPGG